MGNTADTRYLTKIVIELAKRFGRAEFIRKHPADGKTHIVVDENETDLGHRVRFDA